MKFKKIVGFGDSWMYGDELMNPDLACKRADAHYSWVENTAYRENNCFLGLLGSHYNVPTENFGIPGGSLRSTIWTYLWWLEHEPTPEDCLILVALTEADRETFYNPAHVSYSNDPPWNKFVHSTWVETSSDTVNQDWKTMVKQYLVLSSCSQLRQLNYLEAINFFDGQRAKGINLLQFHIMPPPTDTKLPSIILPDFYWAMYFRDHPGNQKRELIKDNGHPNEKGHEIIRDRLIVEIDRAILAQ